MIISFICSFHSIVRIRSQHAFIQTKKQEIQCIHAIDRRKKTSFDN
jgi:hypothetical protein